MSLGGHRMSAWWTVPLGRLDAVQRQPAVDVGCVEPDEVADLVVRDASLVDEPTDEALGDAEAAGEIDDVEQARSGGSWSWCSWHARTTGHQRSIVGNVGDDGSGSAAYSVRRRVRSCRSGRLPVITCGVGASELEPRPHRLEPRGSAADPAPDQHFGAMFTSDCRALDGRVRKGRAYAKR